MKTIELNYLPGDTCWIRDQDRECIIESVSIDENGITYYNWYNLDTGYDTCEVWDDGFFTTEDIGVTVFDTLADLEKAFPEDFDYDNE